MTVNARELEYIISRLASHRLKELNELAEKLGVIAKKIAPSLVRYPQAVDYFSNKFETRNKIGKISGNFPLDDKNEEVRLLSDTKNCDNLLVAALIFSSGEIGAEDAKTVVLKMSAEERVDIVQATMGGMQLHDSVWREFEHVHLLFEVIVSASCFAQLKRHRMATITVQPYSERLGIKIPKSVERCGAVEEFKRAAEVSKRLYEKISKVKSFAADYAILNANRRRVLFDINLRELYHFSRLRSDKHAQWEIRVLSERISKMVKRELPAGAAFLGGKDTFKKT
jgi:thymidylate synthase ThyX